MRTAPTLAALCLGLTAALSACGSDDAETPTSTSQVSDRGHNEADVEFASTMIQHHAQALAMVDTTIGRTLDPAVAALAEDVRAAQTPEIETMADWLTSWGEDVPETVRDHVNADHGAGAHHDDTDATDDAGDTADADEHDLMSAADVEALQRAGDSEFQELWLELMIEHHTAAVEMAAVEVAEGQHRRAVELAQDVRRSQRAEIDRMREALS